MHDGVNKAPATEDDDEEIDEALLDQIAAKMIKDLEAAADSERDGSVKTNHASNAVVDAILQKVRADLDAEEAKSEKNNTLVDAIAFKVKKDLEDKEAPVNDTEEAFAQEAKNDDE